MAIDVLRLGGLSFTDFSVPDLIPGGGHQAMVVHKLPGGNRVIDTLGRDDNDIVWRGQFFEAAALNKCVQLDAMRMAGKLLTLTYAGQSRQVVISQFIYSIRRFPMWVEYAITCTVYQQQPGTSAADSSAADAAASNDAAAGNNAANNAINDPNSVFDTGTTPFTETQTGGQQITPGTTVTGTQPVSP
jgi:hypothetical protein